MLELVVVMAVITILASIAVPTISTYIENKTEDESAERMEIIAEAIQAYARDHLVPPPDLDSLQTGSGTSWRGPYIPQYIQGWAATESDFRNDNWSRPFRWVLTNNVEGTITCAGANGLLDDADDLILQVDIRPLLRELTIEWLKVVNAGVTSYNADFLPGQPLVGDAEMVVTQLQAAGYLSSTQNWAYDAFGSILLTDGSPIASLYSSNVLNGFDPGGGGKGKGK